MPIHKPTTPYPYLILLLLGAFLAFSAWAAFQAAAPGSRVTDADYYSRGLKYNSTLIEKRAAAALGWKLQTRLQGRTLEFRLTDSAGAEVDRAAGTLSLAIPGSPESIRLSLQETTAGYYLVSLGDDLHGAIQARLEFERQGIRFNRLLLLNL